MTQMTEDEVATYVENLLYDVGVLRPIKWFLLDGPSASSGSITLFEDMSIELEISFRNILAREDEEESFPEIADTYRITTDDLEDLLVQRGEALPTLMEDGCFLSMWVQENEKSWPAMLQWFRNQKVSLRKKTERFGQPLPVKPPVL